MLELTQERKGKAALSKVTQMEWQVETREEASRREEHAAPFFGLKAFRAGERAWWLRTLPALAEDLSSVLSAHTGPYCL